MMMKYTISNELINDVVVAKSLEAAELQAYAIYGIDAIGCNIKAENGDFRCTICRKVWDNLLAENEKFSDFSIQDVYNHLALVAYAWSTFDTVTDVEYDYKEGEIEVTRLCELGMDFLRKSDKLGNYMDEIGFWW